MISAEAATSLADVISAPLAAILARLPVAAGSDEVARELALIAPQLSFRPVLSRGGWYRLGGVIDAHGERVADDLARWGEAELAARKGDLAQLTLDYAGQNLRATRLVGKTHYLVASTGSLAVDFIQVEIEALQEVVSHPLFAGAVPHDLEALIAPPANASAIEAAVLGPPFHALRRVTDVAGFLQRMAGQRPEPQIVHRFFDAWQESSARYSTTFCNHWVLGVREYLDRFRQVVLQATPVAAGIANATPAPKFEGFHGAQGLALYEALQRFDRQAGYPMAWFFHMLTTKRVPHAVAGAVIADVQSGFAYLPDRDVQVIRDWLHRPYAF